MTWPGRWAGWGPRGGALPSLGWREGAGIETAVLCMGRRPGCVLVENLPAGGLAPPNTSLSFQYLAAVPGFGTRR